MTEAHTASCPSDGSALEKALLDGIFPPTSFALQCPQCGGSALDDTGQQRVLGRALANPDTRPGARPCPTCGKAMQQFLAASIMLDRCEHCAAVWFDTGELAVVRALIRKAAGEGEDPWASFLADRPLRCAECSAPMSDLLGASDSAIGLRCADCHGRVGLTGQPTNGARTLELRGARVKLEHILDGSYRGSARFELPFDGRLEALLESRSLWHRLTHWGPGRWPATLAAYRIQSSTEEAVLAFVRFRGVSDLLAELAGLGAPRIELRPKVLELSLRGGHPASFERIARLLFARYEAFSKSTG